ncbi:MAG: hypothetical protein ACRYGP_33425 [Janthinobacterium lividum]
MTLSFQVEKPAAGLTAAQPTSFQKANAEARETQLTYELVDDALKN